MRSLYEQFLQVNYRHVVDRLVGFALVMGGECDQIEVILFR